MKNHPPTSRLLSRLVLVLALAAPVMARAQSDGGLPDAGSVYDIPDASVGSGGADQDNPEGDDTVGSGGTCRTSGDCAARFSCSQGRCRYTGIRQAERVGCLLGPEDTLAVVGLGLVVAARRRGREGR